MLCVAVFLWFLAVCEYEAEMRKPKHFVAFFFEKGRSRETFSRGVGTHTLRKRRTGGWHGNAISGIFFCASIVLLNGRIEVALRNYVFIVHSSTALCKGV